jgi:hypothetical protein
MAYLGEVMGTFVGARSPLLNGLRAYTAWLARHVHVPSADKTASVPWLS